MRPVLSGNQFSKKCGELTSAFAEVEDLGDAANDIPLTAVVDETADL